MDFKSITMASILGAIIGISGNYFVSYEQMKAINERLNQSPPLVVVDFVQIASSYPEGASPEELEPLMVQTNEAILKLKGAGYLILDGSTVLGAPNDIYLPKEVLQ